LGAYPIGVFVSSSRRPLLVVHGTQDFISVEQGKRIYDEAAGRKEWVLLEGGNHVCNNMPFRCVRSSAIFRQAPGDRVGLESL
jgi:hypothetical protein